MDENLLDYPVACGGILCVCPRRRLYRLCKRYEALPQTFNPGKVPSGKWADAAWQAGMRYVVFTTKHHDGFCMFDSKYTDYKITGKACPFHSNPRADVSKHIFDAFRHKGFRTGAYFRNQTGTTKTTGRRNGPLPTAATTTASGNTRNAGNGSEDFTYNQIEELMSRYGKMDILWLDGGWVRPDSTITDEVRSWGIGSAPWGQNIDMGRMLPWPVATSPVS
ncbi:MAG: alpha-L-fucosidase [Lewinellaceae bacterium]|nr:alpha-L-fucosidase [Lewinellaceae bacterium]